jgi:dihydrolipoamide dehydrogenase
VRKNSKGVEFLMKKNGVDVVHGRGKVEGPETVRVEPSNGGDPRVIKSKHIVVACGSTPRTIPGFEFDGERVISSDEAMTLAAIPESMVVLGAGAVGVEFASIYARFGSKVTIVEVLPRLVPLEDEEVSKELDRAFRKQGITVMTGARAEKVDRGETLTLTVRDADDNEHAIDCDKLLVAVGRGPVSEAIGLGEVGVGMERGYVKVNPLMQTSVAGIFAIGDIVALPDRAHQQLAHVASHEGILVADHIAGRGAQPINYDQVPACTYCYPEVASVGLTEASARERGYEVKVGKFPFSANSKASILLESLGFVKIVADAKYDEVLGVHIIGPHATDMIAEGVTALRLETTSEELARAMHPHPTLSEAVMEAAHDVTESPIHI